MNRFAILFSHNNLMEVTRKTSTNIGKPKVYITRQVNYESIQALEKHCDIDLWKGTGPIPRADLMKNLPGKQALICMLNEKVDKEILDAGKDLKVIATMSRGYHHLDIAEIKRRNIRIGYTPGLIADDTAELTVAILLSTSRRLFESNAAARNGEWVAWEPFWMCGHGISGSTVGIIGLNRIGSEVLARIKSFKPSNLIYYDHTLKPEFAQDVGAQYVTLDNLLQFSDFVIVTNDFVSTNDQMFNDEVFKKMKSTAIFVNTAKTPLVDKDALVRALQNGTIAGAGLDVVCSEPLPPDYPLFPLKNCIIVPHIASETYAARNLMAKMSVENIVKGLKNEKMLAELI